MDRQVMTAALPRPVGVVGPTRSGGVGKPGFAAALAAAGYHPIDRAGEGVWASDPGGVVGSIPAPGDSDAPFGDLIAGVARQVGVDEQLIRAVVEAESNFNPRAVSKAGAKGLMQLMDGTARSLGVKDPFDPSANLEGGATFLRSMLDRFGSVPLALAAYNAGPAAVERYGGVPPYQETRSYVDRVLRLQRRNLQASAAASPGGNGNGESHAG